MLRRVLALGLAGAGLVALVLRLLPLDAPVTASWELGRKFAEGNAATRLLNAPIFRGDHDLAEALTKAGAEWPPDWDVTLALDPLLSAAERETVRRRAAYLAAPRRVVVVLGTPGERFRVEMWKPVSGGKAAP